MSNNCNWDEKLIKAQEETIESQEALIRALLNKIADLEEELTGSPRKNYHLRIVR